ncbi:MAG TPA: hypothetical protein VN445_13660, partial [Rectinemataceae bacterium]|nr:hypothetical protein [Rectinemataceae bacterium]
IGGRRGAWVRMSVVIRSLGSDSVARGAAFEAPRTRSLVRGWSAAASVPEALFVKWFASFVPE